ncbi:Hpt domain-containing protein [Hydrogenimonas sp.]
MLIYSNDGKLCCISKKALQLAGYNDLAHFLSEHRDYSELFVKKPGYIYNFENFSWLSFLKNANPGQKKVLLSTNDRAMYECELEMETLFPVEQKAGEEGAKFYYQVEFHKMKLVTGDGTGTGLGLASSGESPMETDVSIPVPSPEIAKTETPENISVSFGAPETGEKKERGLYDVDLSFGTPAPEEREETKKSSIEEPLDFVDFSLGFEEKTKPEEPSPTLTFGEPSLEFPIPETHEKEESPIAEEFPGIPEIGLKEETFVAETKEEIVPIPETEAFPETQKIDIEAPVEPVEIEPEPPAMPAFATDRDIEVHTPADKTEREESLSMEMPDIRKVAGTLGLPETMVKAFIKEFVDTYFDDIEEVKKAMEENHLHFIKIEAMKLKGIASNLMMQPLTATLEKVLSEETGEGVMAAWNEVDAYMHELAALYSPESLEKFVRETFVKSSSLSESETETTETKTKTEIETLETETTEKTEEKTAKSSFGRKINLENLGEDETIEFDPAEAADALGLPESLIIEFVNDFIQQAKDEREGFEKAFEAGDIKTINETAHKLKGVAANLRIEDMKVLMENAQHATSPEEVEKCLTAFYRKLAALTKSMAKEYA